LGLGLDNPYCRIVFFFEFADGQVLGEGSLPAFFESWSPQLRNDTKMLPQLKSFFFHRHIYNQWAIVDALIYPFSNVAIAWRSNFEIEVLFPASSERRAVGIRS
jgi:hypothetical protein